MKILLSIKPEYLARIIDGTKEFEYRRHLASKPVDSILFYATAPVQQIIGEVEVRGTKSSSPTVLWEQTKKTAGISRKEYRAYFHGCKVAHAYILGEFQKFNSPKKISEFGITHAPQSFAYIYEADESQKGTSF